jgi:3-dehydroquinate synthase
MSTEALQQVILNSLEAKKWFIETDEFDRNERLLLNFGHTFGHAIEGAAHFAISHGIAVGLGMLCALEFERRRGMCYLGVKRVGELERHLHAMLSEAPSGALALPLRELSLCEVLDRFGSDKKHDPTHFTMVLIAQSGRVALRRMEKSAQTKRELVSSIKTVLARYA